MSKIRYEVKASTFREQGTKRPFTRYGVYDFERGCFPFEGPALRKVGIERLEWFRDSETAQVFADKLNGFKSETRIDDMPEGDAAFEAAARALIEDERKARAGG